MRGAEAAPSARSPVSTSAAGLPAGFVRLTVAGARLVCAAHVADSLRLALRDGTIYRYAERHPTARTLAGRGIAYAVQLPGDGEHVVVRHNRHGGLLAPLTRDLFRAPTRAPLELEIAERLRAAGVPTPALLGYAVYAAPLGFERADVVTREVPNSFDLSAALTSADAAHRARAIAAAADLVRALTEAGARHHDLNVKNILLHRLPDEALAACVLDVDRVTFGERGHSLEANLARLLRSARKWQELHGARVTGPELDELAELARDGRPRAAERTSS